ncbi:MAG: hypothetical protein WC423_01390 [Vulcanimicrobiota bacterium]
MVVVIEREVKNMTNPYRKAVTEAFDVDLGALQEWEQGVDSLTATEKCLTISEIRNLPELPDARSTHVKECGFCTNLLDTLLPSEEEVADFVSKIREAERKRELV